MAYTKSQLEAIQSKHRTLAITAGAGSGKTSVLIERVINCVKNRSIPLSKVLAITFTEKAASELKRRLIETLGDPLSVSMGYISTFHSLCTRMLRESAPLLGLDPDFGVLDEGAARIILRKSIKGKLLEMLEKQDEDAVALFDELELHDVEELMEELIAYRWHTEKIVKSPCDPFKRSILNCYQQTLSAYDLNKGTNLDFNDLEIYTLKLLDMSEVQKHYQEKFKYVFVDEFQDVNDTQAEMIAKIFNSSKNNLTIVGDPKQSIYRFRGANVAQFERAYANAAHKVALKENWRSSKKIIDFVNHVFRDFEPLLAGSDIENSKLIELTIDAPKSLNTAQLRAIEAKAIAEIIPTFEGTTACLFASLSDIAIFSREFADKGIKHVISGGFGFFELQEIVDVINLLKAATRSNDLVALLAVARSPYINMSDEEIYLNFRQPHNYPSKAPLPIEVAKMVRAHPKAAVLKEIEVAAKELTCSEIIEKFARPPISENVAKLIALAGELESREKMPISTFLSYCDDIRLRSSRVAEYPDASENAVQLMTVHKAKGLQFNNVVLCDLLRTTPNNNSKWRFIRGEEIGIEIKRLPDNNPIGKHIAGEEFERLDAIDKESDSKERERLLYVALTRAQANILIPLHKNASRVSNWHKTLQASLEGFTLRDKITYKHDEQETAVTENIERQKDISAPTQNKNVNVANFAARKKTFTTSEIEAYARCPMEYYLKYDICVPSSTIEHKKSDTLPANVKGDVVHRMIELASNTRTLASDPATLLTSVMLEQNVTATDTEQKSMLRQFAHFNECEYISASAHRNEVPFILKIADNTIKGKLDMMVTNPDGSWEIVDFKTSGDGVDPKEASKKYDLQIRTYGTALVRSKRSVGKGLVTLLFLSENKVQKWSETIDDKAITNTEAEILKIINSINERRFDTPVEPPCRTCAFSINKTCWKRK